MKKKKNNNTITLILPRQLMQMQQLSKKLRRRPPGIKKKQLVKLHKRRLQTPPKLKEKDLQDFKPSKTGQKQRKQKKPDAMQSLHQVFLPHISSGTSTTGHKTPVEHLLHTFIL